jgi:hypothetical protein
MSQTNTDLKNEIMADFETFFVLHPELVGVPFKTAMHIAYLEGRQAATNSISKIFNEKFKINPKE